MIDRGERRRGGLTTAVGAALLVVSTIAAMWWAGSQLSSSATATSLPAPTTAEPVTPTGDTGPVVRSADGSPLPDVVSQRVRQVYSALDHDDLRTIFGLYRPDRARRVAPWSTVESRLSSRPTREALMAAMRTAPAPGGDVQYRYAASDYGIGFHEDGTVAFFGTNQGGADPHVPATSAANVPPSYVAKFAGEWSHHGLNIQLNASGRGAMTFRTYASCSDPSPGTSCEREGAGSAGLASVQLEGEAGSLRLRTLNSNDEPQHPAGQVESVRVVRPGLLEVGSGAAAYGLCMSPTYDESCGA